MCTQTNDILEQESSPRSIKVLLDMPTYQGMTDEEIESLIQYHKQRAVASEECLLKTQIAMMEMEAKIQNNIAHTQNTLDMLQSILDRESPVETLQLSTFTPRSLEV